MIIKSSEGPLSKVIVALDCNNEKDALEIANLLDPKLCNLKIGLELFISCGPSIVKKIHNLNYKIFLDLKLHDISNTVLISINTIGKLGIWMTNIHSSGGKKMMLNAQEELRKVQKDCLLLGVTLLSSLNDKDAFHMIQNMGSMMKDELIGGQIIYPIINENWEIKKEYQKMELKEPEVE